MDKLQGDVVVQVFDRVIWKCKCQHIMHIRGDLKWPTYAEQIVKIWKNFDFSFGFPPITSYVQVNHWVTLKRKRAPFRIATIATIIP